MIFTREQWNDFAADKLASALYPDADEIRREVELGHAALWNIDNGKAYCITRLEGTELVIVAYAGVELAEASDYLVDAARRKGATSMRFHTRNVAMYRLHQRLIKRHSVTPIEFYSRVKL